jgi:plastocyanin
LLSRYLTVVLAISAIMILSDGDANATTVNVLIPKGTSAPGCEATNSCFQPYSPSISVNDEVLWTNADTAAHTVTSGNVASGPDGEFDSGLFLTGASFSHTFESAGTFPYFCMVHPWMIGSVTVSAQPVAVLSDDFKIPVRQKDIPVSGGELPQTITISTDESSYTRGDTMIVAGGVSPVVGPTVVIQVFSDTDTLVRVDQIDVSPNGKYVTEIVPGGALWDNNEGTFTIKATYGTVSEQTQIQYETIVMPEEEMPEKDVVSPPTDLEVPPGLGPEIYAIIAAIVIGPIVIVIARRKKKDSGGQITSSPKEDHDYSLDDSRLQ